MGGSKDEAGAQGKPASKKKAKSTAKSAKQDEKKAADHQRRAEMERKIRERVASEARAFDVINRLIEPNVTAEFLLQACLFIDHSHYEDIVEERSISHLCGYPICSNPLRQVAKKKYHISTKSNTVYDITERKKFCSNRCYHASAHLGKQIPDTPVWTRRGADLEPFHLLQPDTGSGAAGEEVIASRFLGLKEEMSLLEKLDRMEKKAVRSEKPKPARPDRKSLEEGQRLSDQLLSLSREDDLERGMGQLSLDGGDGELSAKNGTSSPVHGDISRDVESGGEKLKKESSNGKCGGQQEASREEVKEKAIHVERRDLALESSLKDLTLQDNVETKSVSSVDDGTEERVDGDAGESKSQLSGKLSQMQNSAISKTQRHSQGGVDSDDDADEEGVVQDSKDSVAEVQKSDISETQVERLGQGGVDSDDDVDEEGAVQQNASASAATEAVAFNTDTKCSHSAEAGNKAGEDQTHRLDEKTKEKPLKQQPGESKSAYIMRLLDQRRNLLSKVADVQMSVTVTSKSTESKTASSAGSIGLDGESDHASSAEPERKEDPDKVNESSKDSSEKFKPSEKQEMGTSGLCRKKKSTQTREKPSTGKTEAEVSPLESMCDVVSAWISAETLDYLGLNSPQIESGQEDGSEPSIFHKDPEMQKKYQELCQRLAVQEKDFDDVLGEEDLEGEKEKKGGKKPLPNYADLKKETEDYTLKVQRFMAGPQTIKSKPTKTNEENKDGEKTESETERPITLPAVDSCNQLLIRRRIVLERLSSKMPSLLPPLGLSVQDTSASLRELVYTFSLTSHNIVLKPVEWTLAGIILLKLMERKCVEIKKALQSPGKSAAFCMVLNRLGHSIDSLGQFVNDMLTQRTQSLQGQASAPATP